MIDAADRRAGATGYVLQDGRDVLHVWPFDPAGLAGVVVLVRDGVPVSVAATSAAVIPLRDDNLDRLAAMWRTLFQAWRRR